MSVSTAALRMHLEYSAWASRRLVDAAAMLTPEERTRDFQTSNHSVLGTLAHIFAADRVWLGRLRGSPPGVFFDADKDMRMETLERDWPAVYAGWMDWIAEQNDATVQFAHQYQDMRGNPHKQFLWQIVLHVVNHGTHHRGQVSGMIRAMGHPPPMLDLIYYYRESAI